MIWFNLSLGKYRLCAYSMCACILNEPFRCWWATLMTTFLDLGGVCHLVCVAKVVVRAFVTVLSYDIR
jgi:hypothetical protein